MEQEHYFSDQPDAPSRPHSWTFTARELDFHVTTDRGVFSSHRLDLGTEVLLRKAPDPEASVRTAVDLGCGWGPLTLVLGRLAPQAQVYGVDVNQRARELTAANAAQAGLGNVRVGDPAEVSAQLPEGSVDLIWSNPPIRIGKDALHALLLEWLGKLSGTGAAYLVVGKNLGADSLAKWLGAQGYATAKLGSAKGFRVIEVRKI